MTAPERTANLVNAIVEDLAKDGGMGVTLLFVKPIRTPWNDSGAMRD
jgi:hypothetical protein